MLLEGHPVLANFSIEMSQMLCLSQNGTFWKRAATTQPRTRGLDHGAPEHHLERVARRRPLSVYILGDSWVPLRGDFSHSSAFPVLTSCPQKNPLISFPSAFTLVTPFPLSTNQGGTSGAGITPWHLCWAVPPNPHAHATASALSLKNRGS